jgi:cytoskeletal protein CcmA (bactofilin family)
MNDSSKSAASYISSDMKIDGHIDSTGTILISGQVTGNVKANSVTLESSGVISGNVRADDTELMGAQKGNISSKKLAIFNGAKLRGNITCEELIVEHGSDITGKISASSKAKS